MKGEKLKGSYGKSIVIMSSDPDELYKLLGLLKSKYRIVMDMEVMDNMDYAVVIVSKEV